MNLTDPIYHDDAKARAHLEKLRWPGGAWCPRCGEAEEIVKLAGAAAEKGLYNCRSCRRKFSVTVGTVFEATHIGPAKWLLAFRLMASSKKGISAKQLERSLDVTYKTAWFMAHRIREAMREPADPSPLGGEGMVVEADETVVGGKEKNKHLSKRNPKNIGAVGKQVAFTLVERGGRARSFHVTSVNGRTLRPIIVKNVRAASTLMTDDAGQYRPIGREFADHQTVNHGIEEYVRGEWHSNTVEGYFAILKRGVIGTFHSVSEAHLHRYLAEFDFRYNTRVALGVNDTMRTDKAIQGAEGKRLTYRRTRGAAHA